MITQILRYCWQTTRFIGGLVGAVLLIGLLVIWATTPVPKTFLDDSAIDDETTVVNLAINGNALSEAILPRHSFKTVSSMDAQRQQGLSLQPTPSFTPSLAIDQGAREAFEQRRQDQAAWQTVQRQPSLATAPYQRRPGVSASVAVIDTLHEVHFLKQPVAATELVVELVVSQTQLSAESLPRVEVAEAQPVMNAQAPLIEKPEVDEFRSVVQEIKPLPAPTPQRTAEAWESGRY